MRLTLHIFFLLLSSSIFSQNLVPNSDFENYFENEKGYYRPYNWISIKGSPDFYIYNRDTIYTLGWSLKNGQYYNSKQKRYYPYPYTTNSMYCLFYSESIGIHLKDTLEKDTVYYLEFMVTCADKVTHFTKDVGIFLTDGKQDYAPQGRLLKNIEPVLSSSVYIDDKYKWYKVSGKYNSNGNENFLIFGRTINKMDTTTYVKNNNYSSKMTNIAHYVDNFKIIKYSDYIDSMKTMLLKNRKLIFSDINFKTNSYAIDKSSYFILDNLLEILTRIPEKKVLISGHTDNTGNEQDNILLSHNRAKEVVNYLTLKGVSANRLRYKGFGSSKPLATNSTEYGKAKNRRVEIELVE